MPKAAPARGGEPLRNRARGLRVFAQDEFAHARIGDIGVVHDAYVADPRVREFILRENPEAARAIAERLAAARRRGFWHPRRNDVDADLAIAGAGS